MLAFIWRLLKYHPHTNHHWDLATCPPPPPKFFDVFYGWPRLLWGTYRGLICYIFAGISFYLNATVNPFLYSLLSKRFRRGYQDLKSSFFCQNATLTDSNQVPCINGASKTGIGMDSNPVPSVTRMPLIQLPKLTCQNEKSNSMGQFLPNHTTSYSKHSFISEPQRV